MDKNAKRKPFHLGNFLTAKSSIVVKIHMATKTTYCPLENTENNNRTNTNKIFLIMLAFIFTIFYTTKMQLKDVMYLTPM